MNLLQNKTVCLRAPEPEDLELLYSWENNPEWWEIGNTLAPYSRYLLKEYIAESHRGIFDLKQLRLMIDLCSTGATVGMLDLYDFDPHHRRAGVGILVDPLYQKNGLATEALELLAEYAFSYLKLHQWHIRCKSGSIPFYQGIYRYRYCAGRLRSRNRLYAGDIRIVSRLRTMYTGKGHDSLYRSGVPCPETTDHGHGL